MLWEQTPKYTKDLPCMPLSSAHNVPRRLIHPLVLVNPLYLYLSPLFKNKPTLIKKSQTTHSGEGLEKREHSYSVGGDANWCSHYGEYML